MDQQFTIRTYGFSELAQLYFPSITKRSASWQLKRWIDASPELKRSLECLGRKSRQRLLSPAQVSLIVHAFGEP
jgi:hypothetical protein